MIVSRLLYALLFLALPGWAGGNGAKIAQAQALAVKGGKVITMAGEPIEKGVVLIKEGKIAAVGADVEIPLEAHVIDAAGKVVMPGFVEAHSSAAMSQANETNPNVPFLSVMDSIDPNKDYFEDRRRNGVTTIGVSPGNRTMIGGQTAIIKSAGGFVEDMVVKRSAAIKLSLMPRSGASRMSHYAKLRNEFEKARLGQLPKEEPKVASAQTNSDENSEENGGDEENQNNQQTPQRPASTQADAERRQQALQKLLAKEMQAIIYCENAMDALQAISLTKKFDLNPVLVLGRECYQAAPQIAASKFPVILDSTLVFWKTDPDTDVDEKIVLPRIFRKHKIPLAFQASESTRTTLGESYLWFQAATAVKYGATPQEALRAITLRPAEILGVDKLVGTLETGKDADLVVLTGDPLKVNTWVETTIVGGKVVYERDKDTKLKQLLRPKE